MNKQNQYRKNNYFKDEQGKSTAKYKLIIYWLPQYIPKWQGKKSTVWFSYNKRANEGLDWLIENAKKYSNEYETAIIYDNQKPFNPKDYVHKFIGAQN